MVKKALIIGGGMAGSTAAIEMSKKTNWQTTLVEKSSDLGAGVKTNFKSGHPYTYGPRHFLSHNLEVFDICKSLNIPFIQTDSKHNCGSSRVFEAAKKINIDWGTRKIRIRVSSNCYRSFSKIFRIRIRKKIFG